MSNNNKNEKRNENILIFIACLGGAYFVGRFAVSVIESKVEQKNQIRKEQMIKQKDSLQNAIDYRQVIEEYKQR